MARTRGGRRGGGARAAAGARGPGVFADIDARDTIKVGQGGHQQRA